MAAMAAFEKLDRPAELVREGASKEAVPVTDLKVDLLPEKQEQA
jgi:hypothetical protein